MEGDEVTLVEEFGVEGAAAEEVLGYDSDNEEDEEEEEKTPMRKDLTFFIFATLLFVIRGFVYSNQRVRQIMHARFAY